MKFVLDRTVQGTAEDDAANSSREDDVTTDAQRAERAQRAPRFPVHVPVRYRSVGATGWNEGRIENISRSGVFFWTEHVLAVETPLELLFELPLGDMAPGIVCRGRIVRTVPPAGRQEASGLAAAILSYRFVRGRAITA